MDRDCDEGKGESDGLPEIPVEAWEMIKRVKEILCDYTDNEIYTVLLECEMDPNYTILRLLSQDTFEMVKRKHGKTKEKNMAEEKRLHDISSSSDFGGRGGSHCHSENTSYRESGDSADAEYKIRSIGTGDAISSAQSSQVLQHAWSGARGPASMADVVRMGRPGANTSSLSITPTGTSPPPVGAVPEQCDLPNTSSLPIMLYETSFPPLGTAPQRSSYRVTTPLVPPLVEAELHQDLHSQNPCDRAEISQDCQPDEVQASAFSEQLAKHSAAVSSAAAGLEKPSMEKGKTLVLPGHLQVPDADFALTHFGTLKSGLPPAYSSLHKLKCLQSELGEASGAPVDDSSVENLDFRNPEDHGDEQPRSRPGADRENSALSYAREWQRIMGPSLLIAAQADSDSQPRSFLEPIEHSSRESEYFLQLLAAQSQSSRYSSGGSYSSIPTDFMPEDVGLDTFSVPGLPSQALPGIHIAPGATLPRPFASGPDTQHLVSLEHFDNMLSDPSPPQSYASIPSAFQQAHTGEGSSHPLELMQIALQYRNRAPVSHLAQPPAGHRSFGSPTNIPPAGHRSFGSPTNISPVDHRSFGSPTYIPPAGHGSFGNPTNIPPAGHGSFGRPINIPPTGHQRFGSPAYIPPAGRGSFVSPINNPPAGHRSFGSPPYIPPAGCGSFGRPTNIRPAGHGRLGGPTNIPPADHRIFGSPGNIPSSFLHNSPASLNLDEFLSPHEGFHFNPRQVGSSATWVHGPGGSGAISPAPGSTHYYGLREQNRPHPRDEGDWRLLRQHGSQGNQTPGRSQSRGSYRTGGQDIIEGDQSP